MSSFPLYRSGYNLPHDSRDVLAVVNDQNTIEWQIVYHDDIDGWMSNRGYAVKVIVWQELPDIRVALKWRDDDTA